MSIEPLRVATETEISCPPTTRIQIDRRGNTTRVEVVDDDAGVRAIRSTAWSPRMSCSSRQVTTRIELSAPG
jgi:hypothetical protein